MEHQTNTENESEIQIMGKMDFEKYSKEGQPLTPPNSPEKASSSSDSTTNYLSDPQMRRYRTAFSKAQLSVLEEEFLRENYISRRKRIELSTLLQLPENTIKVWFQNRRMKDKRAKELSARWPYPCSVPMSPYLPYPRTTYAHGFGAAPPLSYPRWPAALPDLRSPSLYMMNRPLFAPAHPYLGGLSTAPLDMTSAKLSPYLRPPAY